MSPSRQVTPHVGVWIETITVKHLSTSQKVTPHVGVWIEWGWLKIELTPNVQRTECCLD